MPPFTIAVGAIAESNLRNVKVSAAMYADVATAVDRDGTPTLSAQEASFAVTTVRNSTARQVVFMTDRVVGRLIRGIAVKYRSRREPVPAGFEEIANGLPP